MLVGLTYTAKMPTASAAAGPDDLEEEFDSPATVEAIAGVLRALGHQVLMLGDGEPMMRTLLGLDRRPDLVFNFAEGRSGGRSREACVPAVLEMLRTPYTGSDPLTLAVTLDKDCCKRVVASYGVCVPRGKTVGPQDFGNAAWESEFASWQFPVICKPAFEGSSKGIWQSSLVPSFDRLAATVRRLAADYAQAVLVEEFIDGDELTVGVLGNPPEILGVMRVVPLAKASEPFVYGIEVKRNFRQLVRYECPAALSIAGTAAVRAATIKAWHALGCRDVARFDFRLRDDVPYFLEANPLPGLSPGTSDLVLMGDLVGVPHAAIVERIVAAAVQRLQLAG